MKKVEKYYIGLDLGTNSVGWAVTDERYNLVHLKRKPAIGVNLFDTAQTAAQTRNYRSNRRRLDRRKKRILLLQSLFAEEVAKQDPTFFLRLNNSAYFKEDKDELLENTKFSLFNDKDFTDKDYHKKYKTIYHLQKAIIEHPEQKFDIRLVYLAVHNLIKYRGNFIKQDENLNIEEFTTALVTETFAELEEYFSDTDFSAAKEFFTQNNVARYQGIVSDKTVGGIKKTSDKLFAEFNVKDKVLKNLLGLAVGKSVKLNQIFDEDTVDEEQGKLSVDFKSESFEENYDQITSTIGDVNIVLIDELKRLYDYFVISRLMDGETLVAKAMVEKYEKHRRDLALFKKIFREHGTKEDYRKVFTILYTEDDKGKKKAITDVNYPRYIGQKSTEVTVKKGNFADFKKFLNKMFKELGIEELEDVKKVKSDLDDELFMPLIRSKENATIPYQFNEHQLKLILKNQSKHYPFLNAKDADNDLTTTDKILSIISFKIPYYVGPLVAKDGHPFAWVVRKSNEKVTPWNFSEVIDETASAERFIKRMTNKCTYIPTEDVLPRESILYEEYVALDALNKLKINDAKIDNAAKQTLLTALYANKTPLTKKRIASILKKNKGDVVVVDGIDDDAKISFSSLHKFNNIFKGENKLSIEEMEKVIFYRTIFTEQKMFSYKVDEFLKDKLSEEELKQIKQLKFKNWSRFSRAFLTGFSDALNEPVVVNEKTGEVISIIQIMRDNVLSLQEVLYHEKYDLQAILFDYNESLKDEVNIFEDIENSYLPPSVKRPVRKAIHIVDEIIKASDGNLPTKIFIEVNRAEDLEKKGFKTRSRKDQLDDLYKSAIKTTKELKTIQDELNRYSESTLRSRKLFLYFLQHGKCLYTGNSIPLEGLMTGNYDIDHIIPRSLITDNSIDNICLVERTMNSEKGDTYPLPRNKINVEQMKPFWQKLVKQGFMSEEKYKRLTRVAELSEEEKLGFINRQLVETSQASKAVANLLEARFGKGVVVYSKARRVSDFRHKFGLLKQRDLNKAHHAHDAYLNIVVGNYNDAQTRLAYINKMQDKPFKFNPSKAFEEKNFKDVWHKEEDLRTIKAVLERKNILFTRQTYISKGEFYDQNLSSAGEGNLAPAKENGPLSDTTRYGGYNNLNTSHFAVVEIINGEDTKHKLIKVDSYNYARILNGKQTLEDYITNYLGLKEANIIIEKLPIKSLIKRGKTVRIISGTQDSDRIYAHNHLEPFFSKNIQKYYYYINRYLRDVEILEKAEAELLKTSNESYYVLVGSRKDKEKMQEIEISKERNKKIYLELAEHFSKDIYEHIFGDVSETLKSNLSNFEEMSLYHQVDTIKKLIMLLQTGSIPKLDLTAVGLKTTVYMNRMSTLIKKGDKILIQSITGLYEKEIILG